MGTYTETVLEGAGSTTRAATSLAFYTAARIDLLAADAESAIATHPCVVDALTRCAADAKKLAAEARRVGERLGDASDHQMSRLLEELRNFWRIAHRRSTRVRRLVHAFELEEPRGGE